MNENETKRGRLKNWTVKKSNRCAMFVEHITERWLPTPEDPGLNPVISKFNRAFIRCKVKTRMTKEKLGRSNKENFRHKVTLCWFVELSSAVQMALV